MPSIAHLQQQLEYVQQKWAEEFAAMSEMLEKERKDFSAQKGALLRKVSTLEETNKYLKTEVALMQDAITSRDRQICYQDNLRWQQNANCSFEISEWQQQLEAVRAENNMLKDQQEHMQTAEKLQQQQVFDLQQQVAELTCKNNQLEQQLGQIQALQQVQHQETASSSHGSHTLRVVKSDSSSQSTETLAVGEVYRLYAETQQPWPVVPLQQHQQQQDTSAKQQLLDVMTSLYQRYMVLSLGALCAETARRSSNSSSSSSRVSCDLSSVGTPSLSVCPTGPVSDAGDDSTSSIGSEDVDVICHIISSTAASEGHNFQGSAAGGTEACCCTKTQSTKTTSNSSHHGSSKLIGGRLLHGFGRGLSWCCRQLTDMMRL